MKGLKQSINQSINVVSDCDAVGSGVRSGEVGQSTAGRLLLSQVRGVRTSASEHPKRTAPPATGCTVPPDQLTPGGVLVSGLRFLVVKHKVVCGWMDTHHIIH